MEQKIKHEPMRVYSLDENRWYTGVSPEARKHLLKSMKSIAGGRAPTPSFKLYGKSDVSLVDDFFETINPAGLGVPEWQIEYELSRKKKWGSQGGYKPWKEVKELFELYYSRPANIDAELYKYDFSCVRDKYKNLRLNIGSYADTLKQLIAADKIQDRAAGWPDLNLKKTDKLAQINALKLAKSGNWKNGWFYTFERFNKQKPRIFFPGPFSFMLVEAQYYFPFLRSIQSSLLLDKHKSPFTFWADKIGFDKMFNSIVTPLCKTFDHSHFVYVQRDFEKMDTTVGEEQTMFSLFPRLDSAFKFTNAEKVKWKEIIHFGATSPVVTPDGVYTGYRGKASGANTTNGDETCCNEDYDYVFTNILTDKCNGVGIKFTVVYTAGNGDDGMAIFYIDDLDKLEEFIEIIQGSAEEAAKLFGFRVNDKWHVSTEYGLYCQRMYSSKGNRIWSGYPATLVLNSIVNPEKQYNKSDWDKDYRDLDIIEKLDNAKDLEYFTQLVDFVDNGMKFRLLGRSEKETSRILSKYERYRALQDDVFNKDNEERFANISNSPTVRYLLKKRGLSHLL